MVGYQVKYKSFDEIDEESRWWRIPVVLDFLRKNGFESALKNIVGSESVPAGQFVKYAFGQLKSFNDAKLWKEQLLDSKKDDAGGFEKPNDSVVSSEIPSGLNASSESLINSANKGEGLEFQEQNDDSTDNGFSFDPVTKNGKSMQSDEHFWQKFADMVNQNIVHKLNLPLPEKLKWDGFELLNKIGLQSRKSAEATYVESGLAVPDDHDVNGDQSGSTTSVIHPSIPDIKKATQGLVKQTESVFGALMVLTAAVSQMNKEAPLTGNKENNEEPSSTLVDAFLKKSENEKFTSSQDGLMSDNKKAEEMKALFSTAESAMEAWAMLATSLGHPSFIKSEFEKLCFLDNPSTDTQVKGSVNSIGIFSLLFTTWRSDCLFNWEIYSVNHKILIKGKCRWQFGVILPAED